MTREILIVAAHPDDEVLGCGGTIAKHVASGDNLHLVFMADGVGARDGNVPLELQERMQATQRAAAILGVNDPHFLGLPDNSMDGMPLIDIVRPLERIIQMIKPQVIYTHHYGDLNIDHRLTHQAVMTACRPQPSSHVYEILCFEVMSSTEWATPGLAPFLPNVFVDISAYWDIKSKALEAYSAELRPPPHSRSMLGLESLARHRGHSVGVNMAEAFTLVRNIR